MHKSKSLVLPFLAVFLLTAEYLAAQIAVVVNRENPIVTLSLSQLRDIYLGKTERWKFHGTRKMNIILTDHKQKKDFSKKFYKIATGLPPSKVRLHWMGKMLNGGFRSLPIKLKSDSEIVKYVSENAGAIGFVDAGKLKPENNSLKTVMIDGKNFGQASYPLRK